jgi:hypothetical protein
VAAFVRWVRNYKEGADTDHGYGNTRIRTTGPSPARDYPRHLAALDADARAQGAGSFASAPLGARHGIVERALAAANVARLPRHPTGAHVASDLMGHYFNSPAAQDLCYRAAIGRDSCRGLPGSEQPPAPLADHGERNGATRRSGSEWSELERGAGGHRGEAAAPSANR